VPTREELVAWLAAQGSEASRRDLARSFGLRGAQRTELRALLKELESEGTVERGRSRRVRAPGAPPNVGVIDVFDIDEDGEPLAHPVDWQGTDPPPLVRVGKPLARMADPGVGDRLLARLEPAGENIWVARPLKRLAKGKATVLGIFRRTGDGGRIEPAERGARHELLVAPADIGTAVDGDLVLAEVTGGRLYGLASARIVERIGHQDDAHAISLLAIHAAHIPVDFAPETLAEASAAQPVGPAGRVDLRDIPLVTIDGADARDFDDAVFAEPDEAADNPGGWHLIVAIADVAWYVRPGSALDRDAYLRGNSVYFPDRVVPMLPEALSADLCSLRPREDRACLAAHLWIDAAGRLQRHRFERGLMRSAARLTYEIVQRARDKGPQGEDAHVLERVVAPLYAAFAVLEAARRKRGALEIDLPERKVVFDAQGEIAAVAPVVRLDSHRLIEEFMITANVAAARELERLVRPCMYRIHDAPAPEKVEALRKTLATFGVDATRGDASKPAFFNRLLARLADHPQFRLVNELVLRAQMQAVYSPDNIGHFGLALARYAHFTSPIRRYADLLVHRALVAGLRFGGGALPDNPGDFTALGEHISQCERRAVAAERDAMNRYLARWLETRVGDTFSGTVRGMSRAGLFVAIADGATDGFVPFARMPRDRWDLDESGSRMTGRNTGQVIRLGDPVEVRLVEAKGLTGSVLLELMDAGGPAHGTRRPTRGGARMPGRRRR